MNGAQALVRMLENHGVTHVFGIPGARVESLFEALQDSPIQLVVCRHEQNAAFMAQAMGRLTGRVGVCLVTSGPGVTNLVTGLMAATTEGDPVLAIGGELPIDDRRKHTRQAVDGVSVLRSATKFAAEARTIDVLPEVFGNAVRSAVTGRPGAVFLGLPMDVAVADFPDEPASAWGRPVALGGPALRELHQAAATINTSRRPLVLMGLQSSQQSSAMAVQRFLALTGLPYAATYQGAGDWASPEGKGQYVGRVGLFTNQPAMRLLDAADCLITIGFDPIEFTPALWNEGNPRSIVAIDVEPAAQDQAFLPVAELIGDLEVSLSALTPMLRPASDAVFLRSADDDAAELADQAATGSDREGFPLHPLRVIHELRQVVTPETTLALDVGTCSFWINRYFPALRARQLMVSNGLRAMGVALPWAMAANLARPGQSVISISGDSAFLFSSMELDTARRLGSRFVHLIWNNSACHLDLFPPAGPEGSGERTVSGSLETLDVEAYAAAFGFQGYRITAADQLGPALRDALKADRPVLIDIPIDASDNAHLLQQVHQDLFH
jgi:acetolactate synthase-1/2/3 large subunit